MKNNKMHELVQIKNLMDHDGKDGRLMLYSINKKNKMEGMASFYLDCETIKVYEGKGDGSDDKDMSYEKFIENYDFVLGLENSTIRYTINNDCEFYITDEFINIKQKLKSKNWEGSFAFINNGDGSCYLTKYDNIIALHCVSRDGLSKFKKMSINGLYFKNIATLYTYMYKELDNFISMNMENSKKINL